VPHFGKAATLRSVVIAAMRSDFPDSRKESDFVVEIACGNRRRPEGRGEEGERFCDARKVPEFFGILKPRANRIAQSTWPEAHEARVKDLRSLEFTTWPK